MMNNKHPLLSFIIVNWNTADLLENCLESLCLIETFSREILVIDNNSTELGFNELSQKYPDVAFITLEENLGYSRANNIGLREAEGQYLFLLNPDTEVNSGAISALIEYMRANPHVGIAGPTLWNPDGTIQRSSGPLPTLWQEFLKQTMIFRIIPSARTAGRPENSLRETGMVTGAALVIRRECFNDIGPLDESVFMFYEDTDWCKRAQDAGWQVWFVPGPGVMHVKAAASSRFARTRTLIESQKSTIYYFRKHYGEGAIRWLRVITLCGSIVRSCRSLILFLIGSDRVDQRQRLSAYSIMFKWAMTGRGL